MGSLDDGEMARDGTAMSFSLVKLPSLAGTFVAALLLLHVNNTNRKKR